MSFYTAAEIVLWLLLAAVLGVALGYVLGRGRAGTASDRTGDAAAPVTTAVVPETTRDTGPPAPVGPAWARTSAPDRRPAGAGANRAAFRGAAMPGPGGGQPSAEYDVKANVDSMTYYLPGTDTHQRVTADVWFRDASTAEAAGFRPGRT